MIGKSAIFLLLVLSALMGGCETTKGIATGVGATVVCAAEGVQKDWVTLEKIDAWIRKNLW